MVHTNNNLQLAVQRGISATKHLALEYNNNVGRWWDAQSQRNKFAIALGLPILLGLTLRLWHFLGQRSLWIDEAYVALNILERNYAGLVNQLDYAQLAPMGWLFIERAFYDMFGGLELTLRTPAMLAGAAALVMFPFAARRYVTFSGLVIAVIFFALNNHLNRYSAEIKPYILDTLFSVATLWIGSYFFVEKKPLHPNHIAALLVFGVVTIPFSFPVALLLASLGSLLIVKNFLERRYIHVVALIGISLVWLFEFGALYLIMRASQEGVVDYMNAGYQTFFAPLPPTSLGDIAWYPRAIFKYFQFITEHETVIFMLMLTIVGLYGYFRDNIWVFLFLLAPFVFCAVASSVEAYPMYHRLMLFLFPQTILIAAAGITTMTQWITSPMRQAVPVVLGALLVMGTVVKTAENFSGTPPYSDEHIRPALTHVADTKQPGDVLYVFYAAYPAFKIYKDRTGVGDMPVLQGSSSRADWKCYWRDIARMRGSNRVWLLFSHVTTISGFDEVKGLTDFADQYGTRLEQHKYGISSDLFGQAQLFLYDFSGPQKVKPDLPLTFDGDPDEMCISKYNIS